VLLNNEVLVLNQVHETLPAVLRKRQGTNHCVVWPSLHKMWGDPQKYCRIIPIVENMLPDSPLHVNDTYIREIALKAIFGEAGDDYEGI
jgi:hypothetical protein